MLCVLLILELAFDIEAGFADELADAGEVGELESGAGCGDPDGADRASTRDADGGADAVLAGEFFLTINTVTAFFHFIKVREQVGRLRDRLSGKAGELKILDNGLFVRVIGEHGLARG